MSSSTGDLTLHRAFVALGSNLGDRVAMIEEACREMEARGIRIKRTSSLFETAPMYVMDQGAFLNGACEVETSKSPMELLDTLQSIEIDMGRHKVVDKGPRNIDLDILLYGNGEFSNERLTIPHKLMLEREFVLRPLCQLIPQECPLGPLQTGTYTSHLNDLPPSDPSPTVMTPMPAGLPPITPTYPRRSTLLMAVLNVTPDSFSDGGAHSSTDPAALLETVKAYIDAGVTIIDVGGESTRPNADPVTESEELARVIPAIKLIRSLPEANKVAISIDTYRATVAETAVNAGADIINDISAGLLDPDMLSTMARLQKTVILSHTRGTPKTMNKLTKYPDGVLAGIKAELSERIRAAEDAGVRRWRIIADPGVGFAKTEDQNLAILRHLNELRQDEGLQYTPWLVGVSRKGFVGHITGVKRADERTWGTAAAITAAISSGADIVRIHDVKEMAQVTRMADAIFRCDLGNQMAD
ncbi:folic acid synthesis protein [Arthroderma uncinatum]|uniref:folic acid synthesis protein n=1 Tax=Arthroderma uncinatum TaxID=74035 RepID=UPI00144A97B1|nr:folic acid synthesis protein [Arthroderma uncinatum]KAF3484221.1 folic acid synthesis protein [Arthroderma uncinatum]